MQKFEATKWPWGRLGGSIKVSLNSRRNCRDKKRERSGPPGVPILAFMSLVCQLASIVIIFVVVLLLTRVTKVALAARAKGDRKREGLPGFRERGKGHINKYGRVVGKL